MVLKKILSFALVLVMAIGAFSACGTAQPSANASPAPSAGSAGDAVTGSLTMWISSASSTFDTEQRERFAKKYPNIKLNVEIRAQDAGNDFMTAFAAGNAPGYSETGQSTVSRVIYAGATAPLDDFIAKWDDAKNIKTEMLNNFKIDGKQYAIPMDSYVMVLTYNKRLFEEAGIKNPPATWEELLECAKLLTKPEKQQWGMNLLVSQWTEWWFEYFVWQAGGDLTKENPDGTLELTFTDPAVNKAVDFYRQLIAAKVIQPDLTMDYGNMQQQFAHGNAAMTLNGSDAIGNYVNWDMDPEECGYAPLPKGPSGEEITQMGGNCAFITAGQTPEDAAAAWAWLTFKMSKEEQELRVKKDAASGSVPPLIRFRNDIDYTSIGAVSPDFQSVVSLLTKSARLEFYGKGIVGSYVDSAVRKTVLDPNADVTAIFQEAQDLAYREVANQFNDDVKASKGQ